MDLIDCSSGGNVVPTRAHPGRAGLPDAASPSASAARRDPDRRRGHDHRAAPGGPHRPRPARPTWSSSRGSCSAIPYWPLRAAQRAAARRSPGRRSTSAPGNAPLRLHFRGGRGTRPLPFVMSGTFRTPPPHRQPPIRSCGPSFPRSRVAARWLPVDISLPVETTNEAARRHGHA